MKSQNKYGVSPFYRSHPLTGLVETFSVTIHSLPCMQYFISELIVLIHKHVNAVFISCSVHHVGIELHLEGLLDVHQKTFQVMHKRQKRMEK